MFRFSWNVLMVETYDKWRWQICWEWLIRKNIPPFCWFSVAMYSPLLLSRIFPFLQSNASFYPNQVFARNIYSDDSSMFQEQVICDTFYIPTDTEQRLLWIETWFDMCNDLSFSDNYSKVVFFLDMQSIFTVILNKAIQK